MGTETPCCKVKLAGTQTQLLQRMNVLWTLETNAPRQRHQAVQEPEQWPVPSALH
jgi:hypothetical protein